MTNDQKRKLMARAVTINGKPAAIAGIRETFPRVISLCGSISAEFSWDAIRRVMESRGGAFEA